MSRYLSTSFVCITAYSAAVPQTWRIEAVEAGAKAEDNSSNNPFRIEVEEVVIAEVLNMVIVVVGATATKVVALLEVNLNVEADVGEVEEEVEVEVEVKRKLRSSGKYIGQTPLT